MMHESSMDPYRRAAAVLLRGWFAAALAAAVAATGCVRDELQVVDGEGTYGVGSDWLGDNVVRVTVALVPVGVDCHHQDHGGKIDIPIDCSSPKGGSPAQIVDAKLDDPLFEVLGWEQGTVRLRPVAAGQTDLQITATTVDGTKTASATLTAVVPDMLRITGECIEARAPTPLAFPTSSTVQLSVEALGGGEPLRVAALPALSWGAIVPAEPGMTTLGVHAYAMPAGRQTVHVGSAALPAFDQPVLAFDSPDIDGLALLPAAQGPYDIFDFDNPVRVDVAPLVKGQPVCQERSGAWPRTITIMTPDVCYFGSNCPDPQQCTEEHAGDSSAAVLVHGYRAGTCRLSAVSDSTSHTASLDLKFIRK